MPCIYLAFALVSLLKTRTANSKAGQNSMPCVQHLHGYHYPKRVQQTPRQGRMHALHSASAWASLPKVGTANTKAGQNACLAFSICMGIITQNRYSKHQGRAECMPWIQHLHGYHYPKRVRQTPRQGSMHALHSASAWVSLPKTGAANTKAGKNACLAFSICMGIITQNGCSKHQGKEECMPCIQHLHGHHYPK